MPAMLDDPSAAPIYRCSGVEPFPNPSSSLPADILPRHVTLRDRVTIATIIPFSSPASVPPSLLAYLSDQINKEIELGDTYPMLDTMATDKFASYWFQNFGAVMLLGNIERAEDVVEGIDFTKHCLGSFYIKPNYPGRSSHVCNAGFLVTDASRARGVGRLLGESYLDWAPKLGYTYSIFNLVYETNVASCKIWDGLGFKRVGRVKGAGNLRSYPGQFIDAIIYGRDLGQDTEDFVSEERFDKIKFYLQYGQYPNGSDRAEKSRLRSAAASYKLIDEKLMLKGKEVISDPQMQYEIAKSIHDEEHAGINKSTASVSARFHWVRIKETITLVIKNCTFCKEVAREKASPAVKDVHRRRHESSTAHVPGIGPAQTQRKNTINGGFPEQHNFESAPNQQSRLLVPDHLKNNHNQNHYQQPPLQTTHSVPECNAIPLDPQLEDVPLQIQLQQGPINYPPQSLSRELTPPKQIPVEIRLQHPSLPNLISHIRKDGLDRDQDTNMLSE